MQSAAGTIGLAREPVVLGVHEARSAARDKALLTQFNRSPFNRVGLAAVAAVPGGRSRTLGPLRVLLLVAFISAVCCRFACTRSTTCFLQDNGEIADGSRFCFVAREETSRHSKYWNFNRFRFLAYVGCRALL